MQLMDEKGIPIYKGAFSWKKYERGQAVMVFMETSPKFHSVYSRPADCEKLRKNVEEFARHYPDAEITPTGTQEYLVLREDFLSAHHAVEQKMKGPFHYLGAPVEKVSDRVIPFDSYPSAQEQTEAGHSTNSALMTPYVSGKKPLAEANPAAGSLEDDTPHNLHTCTKRTADVEAPGKCARGTDVDLRGVDVFDEHLMYMFADPDDNIASIVGLSDESIDEMIDELVGHNKDEENANEISA